MITILTAEIVYDVERVIRCQCRTVVRTPLGDSQITGEISLLESRYLPQSDWTDADLCAAVAQFLEVSPSEVEIANDGAP